MLDNPLKAILKKG